MSQFSNHKRCRFWTDDDTKQTSVYDPLFLLDFVLSILYFRTIKEQLL